jgi:hypothetical protein
MFIQAGAPFLMTLVTTSKKIAPRFIGPGRQFLRKGAAALLTNLQPHTRRESIDESSRRPRPAAATNSVTAIGMTAKNRTPRPFSRSRAKNRKSPWQDDRFIEPPVGGLHINIRMIRLGACPFPAVRR